jgi:hypothetical protein
MLSKQLNNYQKLSKFCQTQIEQEEKRPFCTNVSLNTACLAALYQKSRLPAKKVILWI